MATEEEFEQAMRQLLTVWSDRKIPKGRLPITINSLGYLGSAKQLVMADGETGGFKRLVESGWWNLTIEALVLRANFANLFSAEELAAANKKLEPWRGQSSA